MNNFEQASKDKINVYFIENHISTCSPTISLSGDAGGLFGELKKEKEKKFLDPGREDEFLYSIYHFEIYPEKIKEREKSELKIKLILENKNEKFDYKLIVTDFERNNYIYDLDFKSKGLFKNVNPPKSNKFSRSQQFEIYRDYLEKDLGIKKKNDKKREDLVFFTQKLLEEKFIFSFYILLFLESLFTKNFRKHFNYFNPQKIEGKGDITKYIRQSNSYVNIIRRKPDQVLSECKDEKEKEQSGIKLFAFILYFYYEYIHDEFPKSLESKDEKSKFYINNALLNYSYLFIRQKLTKERVQELIQISRTYSQFSNALQYLDILIELLDLVELNFQRLKELYKSEKANKQSIDVESIITPRKEDDIKAICEKYKKLSEMQKKEIGTILINISGSLFDKYICYFEGVNIDYLFYINDLAKSQKITLGKDLKKTIIETGLILSKTRKMTNLQIIDFIQKLNNEEKLKESLEIIPSLEIKNFDNKFYEEWKKMNWNKLLENNSKLLIIFTDKILEIITDLKDFDILFNLINISTNQDDTKIRTYILEKMHKKFIELYKIFDFSKNKDFNFNTIIISLITYSKNKKEGEENILEFLKQIQTILNENNINDIYKFLLSEKEGDLTEKIIKFIINFYTSVREINAEILLERINKCSDQIKGKFLDNLVNAIPNENDLLQIDNSEKYKLFRGLLEIGVFKNERFISSQYIKKINELTSKIQKKLISGEMKYTEISPFYDQRQNEEEKEKRLIALSDKLLSIFFKDENKASQIKSDLDKYNATIKIKLDSLNLILEDFLGFFNETQKENIKELLELIKNLSSGPVNFYEKNKERIENLINSFEEGAKKRNSQNKSSFFIYIYRGIKKKYKKDEEQILIEKAEKDFNKLKTIFDDNGVQALNKNDKDLLKSCLESIKGKKEEEILNEIEILIKLFEIEISQDLRNKLVNSLVLLSKKEDILEIASAISIFIKEANLSKKNIWNLVDEINNKKEGLNDEKILNDYINDLKKFDIDIDLLYEPGYYLNILLTLYKKSDSITFLFGKKEEDCRKLQEAAGDDDTVLLNVNDIKNFEECVIFPISSEKKKISIKWKTLIFFNHLKKK